jgi:hypothetical protein
LLVLFFILLIHAHPTKESPIAIKSSSASRTGKCFNHGGERIQPQFAGQNTVATRRVSSERFPASVPRSLPLLLLHVTQAHARLAVALAPPGLRLLM